MKYERYILPVLLVLELLFHLAGALLKSRREVCVFVFNLVGGTPIELCGKTLGVPFFFCKPTCLVVPAKPLKQTLGAANPSQLLPRISMEQLVVESFFSNQLFSEANTTAGPTLPAFFFSFLLFFASLLLARLEVLFIPIAILRNS